MSIHDLKQYHLMLSRLEAFRRSDINIDALIADLRGLLNALHEADPDWKQTFLHWWGQIEDARAYARYREAKVLSPEETQNVFEAVQQLETLIRGKATKPSPPVA